ncbi:MAG TPA: cytochrome c [Bacteroidia bacterium]|nr:cytochrome c [Bacteroidia bacterium]
MNSILKNVKSLALFSAAGVMLMLSSCDDANPLSPGLEYMPDMYRSEAYKPYTANPVYKDSMEARMPVPGTISQGAVPNSSITINELIYPYPNTPEGYEAAGLNLKNPLAQNAKNLEDGKVIFTKMCIHCHGAKGDGAGSLKVAGEVFPVPSYTSDAIKNLPEGKMFHTLNYGKGLMGSHASQLSKEERWKCVMYVQQLQREALGAAGATAAVDSTKTASAEKK